MTWFKFNTKPKFKAESVMTRTEIDDSYLQEMAAIDHWREVPVDTARRLAESGYIILRVELTERGRERLRQNA